MCVCWNTPRINFMYVGKKEICFVCKACCISLLFSTRHHLLNNFIIFFCSNNTFFINLALKLKHQSGYLRLNMVYGIVQIHNMHAHLNTVWYHTAFTYIEALWEHATRWHFCLSSILCCTSYIHMSRFVLI